MTDTTTTLKPLTRFQPGSFRELSMLSFPLILQALSGTLMYFLDRVILGHYSTASMNAAATAGMVCAVFQYGGVAIASIAEVFVGQNNGAKKYHLLAEPVWQMVWFSLACNIIFIPLALWSGPVLLPESQWAEGMGYYQWIMAFACLMPLIIALSSFFIGQGMVILTAVVVALGNLLNFVLDIAFVFGIENWLAPMGTTGAAIATVLAQVFQVVVLAAFFLRKKHRQQHYTGKVSFNKSLFWQQLKIGTPIAIGHMIEISAWAFLLQMMAWTSERHLTVMTIGQTLFIFLAFFTEGLNKAVMTLSSNFIGAKRYDLIPVSLFSSGQFVAVVMLLLVIPLLVYPEVLVAQFLTTESVSFSKLQLIDMGVAACFWVWIYFFFDLIVWSIAGVLTAAGDTRFVMVINAINAWFFAIMPIYYFIVMKEGSADFSWAIICIYGAVNASCFIFRYKQGIWRTLSLNNSNEEITTHEYAS